MNKNIAVGLALASLSVASYATDFTWTGTTDNNWSNTANWVGGTLPTSVGNTNGDISGIANNIILQDNASYSPALNVPKYALYGSGRNPAFTLGAGTTLAIEAGVQSLGDSGIDRIGQVATVGAGASLTFIRDSNMTLTRDPNGTSVYTVNGGALNFRSGRLDFGFDSNRFSKFELNAGTVNLARSSGTMAVFGSRFGNDFSAGYSLITLTNSSAFNISGDFRNNMHDANGNGAVVFDLQDTNSMVVFNLGGIFADTAQLISDGFGVNFKSSTLGDGNLVVTESNGIATVQVIPEPATLGMIGLVGGLMLFIRRQFMM